ncbi:MAG: T9SS type A sorting domain-containing protein, partial [Bacteroidota bacterium]
TQYRVGVRNYNSSSSAGGSFVGCIRHLMAGNCDSGNSVTWPGTLNRCSTFKAKYATTGVQYRYTFTGISGIAAGNVYTRTQSSDYLNLNNLVPSIPSGCSYNVIVTNIYTLSNGAGATEIIEVSQYNPTTINVTVDPLTQLRDSDRCAAGPRFRNAIIASLPWVCGVSNWRWRFTEVDNSLQPVGLTFELNRGAASNYLNLATVSQIQYGKTYAVQTAPVFTYTGSNYIWGPVQYICIIGQAGMVLNGNNESFSLDTKDLIIANAIQLNIYPNPSNGQNTFLNISGIEDSNVKIRVFNSMGQLVSQCAATCILSGTQVKLPTNGFACGMYFVELYSNGEKHQVKLLIQE